MIEISCNHLYNFYLEENQVVITNQIVKMTGAKKTVLDAILVRMFGLNSKTNTAFHTITPVEFMKKFNQDKIVIIIFII